MTEPDDAALLRALLDSPTDDFAELTRLMRLDPATSFRNGHFVGLDFGTADLTGFVFAGADLRGADFSKTRGIDPAGFAGAKVTGVRWPGGRPVAVPPAGFSLERVREKVLAGEAVPNEWIPFILRLSFKGDYLLDITTIANFYALQYLDICDTPVHDIKSLADLINLHTLILSVTNVENISPLSSLANLRELLLGGTLIVDIRPLAGMSALRKLHLWGTKVADITPLAALNELQDLVLRGTQVTDVRPLASMRSLRHLDLGHTPVVDVTALAELHGLRVVMPDESRRIMGGD